MVNSYKYSFLRDGSERYLKYIGENNDRLNMKRFRLWYEADIDQLLYYYKSGEDRRGSYKAYYTPSFLELAPTGGYNSIGTMSYGNNYTVYHDPIATNISRAMSGLLFSQAPISAVTVKSKAKTKELNETLKEIIADNELNSKLQTSAEQESYSGAVAFKTIIDPDFSDHPIVMTYPKEQIIINRKYDRVVSIVFMDEYTEDKDTYILFSEYGKGYIKYKLVNHLEQEVPLDTIEDTAGLTNLEFVDQNGELLDMMLAVYKENKPGARSDYENCIDDFQAVDEIFSQMMDFIRKTGVKRVIAEANLQRDKDGNVIVPAVYGSDVIVKWNNSGKSAQNVEETNEVQTVKEIQQSIEGYKNALTEVRENIARTVKLSIKTILGKDTAGANESDKALMIRENQDNKTRSNKLISWNEAYIKLIKLLMMLDTAKIFNNVVTVNTMDEMEVSVEFYNPTTPTFEQMIEEVTKLLEAGLIDDEGALERLWIELSNAKTPEEVKEMYDKIYGVKEKPSTEQPQPSDDNIEGEDDEESSIEEENDEEGE